MADLAFDHDEADPQGRQGSAFADPAGERGVLALDGRCYVQTDQPLDSLSTPGARAYVAVDAEDATRQFYALIINSAVPFRLNVITGARDLKGGSVVKLAQWGSVDWPLTGRRETILLLERPPGDPLMPSLDAQITPLKVPDIARHLMQPMASLLAAMGGQRLAHRNIRPTNLFRTGRDGPIVAGEFYSAPPGFNQPAMFEPLERAMCMPAGRGAGETTDDLFALGVTALWLSLGRNPVAGIDDETLLAKRAEMGSYAALTMRHKPPGDLARVIRSLLHDNRNDRWTVDDLLRWADLGVAVQAHPGSIARADRGFEFAGGRYHTRRELALALGKDWPAARELVRTDAIERWAERSIKDRELTQQIADCRLSGRNGPRMVNDDLLLARTMIVLDPDGPVRFRGLNAMPDGLGGLAALAASDSDLAATFGELVSSQLIDFWFQKQVRPGHWASAGKSDGEIMFTCLAKPGPGFGIERCAYDMNRGLACQSPRFKDANAIQIREFMAVLDARVKKGEQNLDRHVAAFLGARYSGSVDAELTDFANARDGADAMLAQLRLFAAIQFKHGPHELKNLAASFVDHLDILLTPYKNIALRARLRRAAERTAPSGKLPELLGIVRNKSYMELDKKGFERARNQYRELGRLIREHENSLDHVSQRAQLVGRKAAAYLATVISVTVVVIVLLSGPG